MIQPSHTRIDVREPEDVGAVRRAAGHMAGDLGASRADVGRVELVATEVASNLKRHATAGAFALLRGVPAGDGARACVELLSVDSGPGITDTARPASVGIKREGLGVGMASVGRLASTFDVFTRPELGTVALARVAFGEGGAGPADWRVGGLSVALFPASGNGDGWAYRVTPEALTLLVVDGLGHGAEARRATDVALALFERGDDDVAGFVRAANAALRPTRGAALSLCRVVPADRTAYFMGIGNVEGRILTDGRALGLVGRTGTLGMMREAPMVHITAHPWSHAGSTLLLHTDGVRGTFEIAESADLFRHDPSVIAAAIYRDHVRGRDDATVVAVRGADASLRESGARIV